MPPQNGNFPRANGNFARENGIFTARRIRLYAFGMLFASTFALAWQIGHGRSVFDAAGRPVCIDFCTTWLSGRFAASADPVSAYDYATFAAAQAAQVGPQHGIFPPYHFFYPPTFFLLTYLLALMPYFTAYAVWTAFTLLLYAAAVYRILPSAAAVAAALTPLVVGKSVLLGQNGLFTAALIGLGLVWLERRPILAGLALGMLVYKPNFAVLFPFALAAGRSWRAIASAALTAIALALLATFLFGAQGWVAFIDTFGHRTPTLSTDPQLVLTLQSVFGMMTWAGAGPGLA
jgi:Glycosyltransferase family 87